MSTELELLQMEVYKKNKLIKILEDKIQRVEKDFTDITNDLHDQIDEYREAIRGLTHRSE